MSQYQKDVKDAIKRGLNLPDDNYQEEYYVGRYISGWKHPITTTNKNVGHRKVDAFIPGHTIYKVNREVIIEADGTQHRNPMCKWNDPDYKKGKLIWTRAQKFNDQIDRDKWVNNQAWAKNQIVFRIQEPDWLDNNPAYYDQKQELIDKLQSPGYMSRLIQDAQEKNYKGYVITWDDEKPVTQGRNWHYPKYL